jgi:hypothetical protein
MGKLRNAYKILVEKPQGKSPFEHLGVDRRIILKWILGKWGWRLRIGTGGGLS